MKKIASPTELQTELRRLLAYSQSEKPSRAKLASEMRKLADRVVTAYGEPDPSDTEVWLNIGRYGIEVVVTGPDNRSIQSAESSLRSAAEDAGATIDDNHPQGVRPPHDWGYMGFTADDEPEYLDDLVRALTKEAKSMHWITNVRAGKGWPRF